MKLGVTRWLTIAPVMALAASMAHATSIMPNLVQNGDFSSSSSLLNNSQPIYDAVYQWQQTAPLASPWVFSSAGSGIAANGSGFNYSGELDGATQVAFLQLYNGPLGQIANSSYDTTSASISQTISDLTVGSWYTLSFDLEGRPGYSAAPVVASIDGATISATPVSGTFSSTFSSYSTTFQATGAVETLVFSSTLPASLTGSKNYDLNTAISNVSLVDPSRGTVPEGGSPLCFLLLAAMASLVAMRMNQADGAV